MEGLEDVGVDKSWYVLGGIFFGILIFNGQTMVKTAVYLGVSSGWAAKAALCSLLDQLPRLAFHILFVQLFSETEVTTMVHVHWPKGINGPQFLLDFSLCLVCSCKQPYRNHQFFRDWSFRHTWKMSRLVNTSIMKVVCYRAFFGTPKPLNWWSPTKMEVHRLGMVEWFQTIQLNHSQHHPCVSRRGWPVPDRWRALWKFFKRPSNLPGQLYQLRWQSLCSKRGPFGRSRKSLVVSRVLSQATAHPK